jgi:hypothetical protein
MTRTVRSLPKRVRERSGAPGPAPGEGRPQVLLSVLSELFRDGGGDSAPSGGPPVRSGEAFRSAGRDGDRPGRFDFDLAEFPLFRFQKNMLGKRSRDPLVYSDTIRGRDGRPVAREWRAYPGPFGFGGPSTQVLLYDLLQLYAEQGFQGSQLMFGTIRSLLLRRGTRNPSKRDYERVRRDMDILRGYDFHCRNAFWDQQKQAYVDMNWRLFGSVFYFKPSPEHDGQELPFGFIEVSPVLRQIAQTRGFFSLGFPSDLFYRLKPLEQRLAVYLAKRFTSQQIHRRFVDDLARALPIEAARPRDARQILREAAKGLLAKELPILRSFSCTGPRDGRWVAEFVRREAPRRRLPGRAEPFRGDPGELDGLVERIIEETGGEEDRLWWTQCALRLGRGPVERALGQLREACREGPIRSKGALLTKILKDLAVEADVVLRAR